MDGWAILGRTYRRDCNKACSQRAYLDAIEALSENPAAEAQDAITMTHAMKELRAKDMRLRRLLVKTPCTGKSWTCLDPDLQSQVST